MTVTAASVTVSPGFYRYSQAVDLAIAARDAGDLWVLAAARRVAIACRLGHRVAASDLAIIDAFTA